MQKDETSNSPTGRIVDPSPNLQSLRPPMTEEQRIELGRLREALKEALVPNYAERSAIIHKADFSKLDERLVPAYAAAPGKSTNFLAFYAHHRFPTHFTNVDVS